MRKLVDWSFLILILAGAGVFAYLHPEIVKGMLRTIEDRVRPCTTPITYSIDAVDPKFGISKQVLIANIAQAEDIWEAGADRQLFTYVPEGGDIKVSLVYDERQAATDKLKTLGIQYDRTKSSFEALKSRYDTMAANVASERAAYEHAAASYKQKEAAYNAEVKASNARGGATRAEYQKLQEEKAQLEADFDHVQALQNRYNGDVATINALATTINQLIVQLNLSAQQYNQVGVGQGEFEEGLYRVSGIERTITIYEYSDKLHLIRVLAHEMGHALGLDHVEDAKAIMYKINQGKDLTLASDDVAALKGQCKL